MTRPSVIYDTRKVPATIANDREFSIRYEKKYGTPIWFKEHRKLYIQTCKICKRRFMYYTERKTCSKKCLNKSRGRC